MPTNEVNKPSFYYRHYSKLTEPLIAMMMHGTRYDVERAKIESVQLLERRDEIKIELTTSTGGIELYSKKSHRSDAYNKLLDKQRVLNAKKTKDNLQARKDLTAQIKTLRADALDKDIEIGSGISNQRIMEYLYRTLKIPARMKKGKETVDEVALKRILNRFKDNITARTVINLILEHRRCEKMAQYVDLTKVDRDGRVRCHYKIAGTETGRLASATNPRRTGMNLQNIPGQKEKCMRHLFMADEGMYFFGIDLSQVEYRILCVKTGDPFLIERARTKPWLFDIHTFNAALIFKITEAEVTKEQRYIGKRVVHASSYGMTGQKMSDILVKEGYVYTPEECQDLIEAYMARTPAIREWQQRVTMEIIQNRKLTSSWGRVIHFNYERLDDELYRRGFAWTCQTEAGDLLNQYGVIPCYQLIKRYKMRARMNLQNHDELVVSAPLEELYDLGIFLKTSLERPRVYNGVELSVPAEPWVGTRWMVQGVDGKFHKELEFKHFPESKDDFERQVLEVMPVPA